MPQLSGREGLKEIRSDDDFKETVVSILAALRATEGTTAEYSPQRAARKP